MEESIDIEKHMRDLVNRMGGAFKLTSLLQKRIKALKMGAQKLVETSSNDPFDIAFAEILEGKVALGLEEKEEKGKKKKK